MDWGRESTEKAVQHGQATEATEILQKVPASTDVGLVTHTTITEKTPEDTASQSKDADENGEKQDEGKREKETTRPNTDAEKAIENGDQQDEEMETNTTGSKTDAENAQDTKGKEPQPGGVQELQETKGKGEGDTPQLTNVSRITTRKA